MTDYRFRDKYGTELTDDATILFIQLPEADKILDKPVKAMTPQEMWAIFFRHMSDKDKRDKLKEIMERKEGIKMAANMLYEISQDEKARIQYENELLADLDARSWVSDAWEDGFDTTLLIINELKDKIPVDEIAAKYNLSVEQILRVQSVLEHGFKN